MPGTKQATNMLVAIGVSCFCIVFCNFYRSHRSANSAVPEIRFQGLALFVQWFLTVPLGIDFYGAAVAMNAVISLTAVLPAGDFRSRKYTLINQLRRVDMTTNVSKTTGKAASSAESVAQKASEAAQRTADRLSEKAENIGAQVRSVGRKVEQQGEIAAHHASQYLRQHPFTVLGIVFASGLLVSALLRK
jgi:ElaB/YqjD/DUF883 family membrane-anchored ribosome-binding protein